MNIRKTLLLNSGYEIHSFINERRAIKLLIKDKVEVISSWEGDSFSWDGKQLNYPSILKLKNYVKRHYRPAFTRNAIIRRDKSICQYCRRKLTTSQITIDHVIPKSQNGPTSFFNCVVACQTCNLYKGSKTPEQAQMKLIRKPADPSLIDNILFNTNSADQWHPDWNQFLNNNY